MSNQQVQQSLGKYTIVHELGRGGFAAVYLAQDTVLRRSVALKILHPQLLVDPAFVARFENDARAAAQLDHPHIAMIFELGQIEGRLCIAMQLLPGGTLAERIRERGPLPFAEALRTIEQVASALEHAHAAGFVHRDVKPTNIIFNARGEAVLTDFGMVKAVESSVVARSTMGNVIGTPPYVAPEVWENGESRPATDVYALGCVLFEMLTGELLFKGSTPPAVMLAHFRPHEYPAQWPPGTPPQIAAVLEQALARDLAIRFSGAGALATALRGLDQLPADLLAKPYAALQRALVAQEWARAAEIAQGIIARAPGYRDVRALAQQIAEAQAKIERAREAAQQREAALQPKHNGKIDAAHQRSGPAPASGGAPASLERPAAAEAQEQAQAKATRTTRPEVPGTAARPSTTTAATTDRPSRPIGVSILAILAILQSLLGILLMIVLLLGISTLSATTTRGTNTTSAVFFIAIGIVGLVSSVISLILGIGMWRLKPWAWLMGVILYSIGCVGQALIILSSLVSGQKDIAGAITGVSVLAVVIYYLFTPRVRRAFGRDKGRAAI